MMGKHLSDPHRGEGGPAAFPGLGFLPAVTDFVPEKITREKAARSLWPEAGHDLSGYEIHHGRTRGAGPAGEPLAEGGAELGWVEGRAVGAYLHGLLASDPWRGAFLNRVRADRGHAPQPVRVADPQEVQIARWADHLRRSLRPGAWECLLGAVRP
jgi:adenosylcobyric acid synthase